MIITPTCPLCDQPPTILLDQQAFCGTDDCPIWMWNPTVSLDDNLTKVQTVEVYGRITCPVCGLTSWNPTDAAEGYCGNCHSYTSAPRGDAED